MEFVPGLVQGLTRTCIGYPFDYMKIQAQHNPKYSFIRHLTKLREDNKYGKLYRGISLPLIMNPLRRSVQFVIYERMNKYCNPFASAATAGCAVSVINVPYYGLLSTYILNTKKAGIIYHLRKRLKSGSAQLMRGYKVEMVRACVTSTMYLGTYGALRARTGTGNLACAKNAIVASVTTWTLTYPLDTMRLWCQVAPTKQSQNETIRLRILEEGILSVWRGIHMTYLRVVPTTVLSMLMYEYARKLVQSS